MTAKPASGSAGIRAHCAVVAGRRRARLLSGRRLPGAGRGRSASRLGRRHLDRRHQLGDHRRQSAGASASTSCARFWETVTAARRSASPISAALEAQQRLRSTRWSTSGARSASCCGARRASSSRACRRPSSRRRQRPTGSASTTPRRSRALLESLVDFDRINAQETRFSVGAVNIRTGNFIYFDNHDAQDRPPSTSWPAARCRRAFPPSRSTASTTGTAASSPTRRCNGCSTAGRARTRSPSRSTCGARAASCRAT